MTALGRTIGPDGGDPGKRRQHRVKRRIRCNREPRPVIEAQVQIVHGHAPRRDPPADAATLVEDHGGLPRIRQRPRTGKARHARADYDGAVGHVRPTSCRMRGICFFTLKNPAVACGQIAASQSRRHSDSTIPASSSAGCAASSQSRSGPAGT